MQFVCCHQLRIIHLCSPPTISLSSTSSVSGWKERSIFSTNGWVLSVHTSFRFKKRKNFFFEVFADGEHSGKKTSPEKVHQNMRNIFDLMEYCSVFQIKFLFSHCSWDLWSSTLPDLAEKITSKGNFVLESKLWRNDNTPSQLISERIIQQALLVHLVKNSIAAIQT